MRVLAVAMYGGYGQAPAPAYGAYGATPTQHYGEPPMQGYEFPMKSPFARGQRRTMNLAAIAVCLFIPWLIFTAVYALLTFSLHYQAPQLSYILCAALLFGSLTFGYFAYVAYKKRGEGTQEPAWYVFLFATSLIAWVVAVVCGQQNFAVNMSPYFDVTNLNVYPSVDPSIYHGQQLMDAGRIMFTPSSHLDVSKSMGFRNLDMYCVAPVTVGPATSQNLQSYDFWAVGLNCCSGHAPDFHCGEYNNPRANSGLRLMRDDQRAYFRLAVQQAEAAYNIRAQHPIFLYWMQDPVAEVNAYQDDGYKYFLLGMFSFFAFQLFLVVVATIAFSKMYS